MRDAEDLLVRVAGPGTPADIDQIRSRVASRRRSRRSLMGFGAVLAIGVAGFALTSVLDDGDPSSVVANEVDPPERVCEAPRSGTGGESAAPPADVAIELVDRILESRRSNAELSGCISESAMQIFDGGEVTGPDGSVVRPCLYFDRCASGDEVLGAEVSPEVTEVVLAQGAGSVVSVSVTYRDAGEITERHTVTWAPSDGGLAPLVTAIDMEVGSLVSASDAETVVRGFLDALAGGAWDEAAALMGTSGRDVTGTEEGSTPSDDVQLLAELEPELAQRGDLAGMLRAYCEDHGGLCQPAGEVVANETESSRARRVTVTLADADVEADFVVSWFESDLSISGLPPRG